MRVAEGPTDDGLRAQGPPPATNGLRTIFAPDRPMLRQPCIFLAGGITGCPDWQEELSDLLADKGVRGTLLNPRRPNFPIHDPSAAPEQIRWEFDALRDADLILFWFCAETVQPIALYELGAWSMTAKPILVGAHPGYPRRLDVVEQTRLARPGVRVVSSLEALVYETAAELRWQPIPVRRER